MSALQNTETPSPHEDSLPAFSRDAGAGFMLGALAGIVGFILTYVIASFLVNRYAERVRRRREREMDEGKKQVGRLRGFENVEDSVEKGHCFGNDIGAEGSVGHGLVSEAPEYRDKQIEFRTFNKVSVKGVKRLVRLETKVDNVISNKVPQDDIDRTSVGVKRLAITKGYLVRHATIQNTGEATE
ncbi:hypothetical protein NM208_g13205 [Fusarium decemcellulare]|uniref:Uncharacterized protein n=1 Tax=Fusarium decemcellulare TaxID=57161 RepID=A0ACC1RM22_9HYPO|nr:hypothetical protein NM208_g13205 [Fusarium decemcellulare]